MSKEMLIAVSCIIGYLLVSGSEKSRFAGASALTDDDRVIISIYPFARKSSSLPFFWKKNGMSTGIFAVSAVL